jgi:hypothetical protein
MPAPTAKTTAMAKRQVFFASISDQLDRDRDVIARITISCLLATSIALVKIRREVNRGRLLKNGV